MVSWRTDSTNTEVLEFTTIPYTVIVSYNHLNYTWLNFGIVFSDVIILCFSIIKSELLFTWNEWGNHHFRWLFLRQILGSKICPDRGLNPSLPVISQFVIAMSYNDYNNYEIEWRVKHQNNIFIRPNYILI